MFYACNDEEVGSSQRGLSTNINDYYYSENQIYSFVYQDQEGLLWASGRLDKAYAKIPSLDSPTWFDIVLSGREVNSLCTLQDTDRYLYIHANNPMAKNFSYDSVVTISSGVNLIYYQGKTVEDQIPQYDKYITSANGTLTIINNDGQTISGTYIGYSKDAISNKTDTIHAIFNKVPISLVK